MWSQIAPYESSWQELERHSGKRQEVLRCERVALGLTPTGA